MIILHNVNDKASRDFVALYGEGNDVYDWYNGGYELWNNGTNTLGISTFPSVIIELPAYDTIPTGAPGFELAGGVEVEVETIPAGTQMVIHKPVSLDDVNAEITEFNTTYDKNVSLV